MDLLTRLFYVALWNFADDEGRGRAIVRELAGFAFPLNDEIAESDIAAAVLALADADRIILYDVDGVRHFQIVNWVKHQSISHPTKSRTPPPENYGVPSATVQEPSDGAPVPFPEPSGSAPGQLPEPSGVGIRNQESGVFLSGGRKQEAGTRETVSGSCGPPGSGALRALPALPSVVNDGPAPPLLSPAGWRDLREGPGHWTDEEITLGLAIVRERPKLPARIVSFLHASILPDVRGGRRPRAVGGARASPRAAVPRPVREKLGTDPPEEDRGVPMPGEIQDKLRGIGLAGLAVAVGRPTAGTYPNGGPRAGPARPISEGQRE